MAIIKGYPRRIWLGANCMDTSFCFEALLRHGCSEIFNTGQGSSSPRIRPSVGCGRAMDSKARWQGLGD